MHPRCVQSSAGNEQAEDRSGAWCPEESDRSADSDVAGDASALVTATIEAGPEPDEPASGQLGEAGCDETERDDEKKSNRHKASDLICLDDPARAYTGDRCNDREYRCEPAEHWHDFPGERSVGSGEYDRDDGQNARAEYCKQAAEVCEDYHWKVIYECANLRPADDIARC